MTRKLPFSTVGFCLWAAPWGAVTALCAHAQSHITTAPVKQVMAESSFVDFQLAPPVVNPLQLGDRDYLQTRGRELVNRDGKVVRLRGVNIGGWLVTEAWMNGQTDDGKRTALEGLEARFGAAKAAALMKAWQDNWFTAKDLDLIGSWGFNLIRVPFSYRNLQSADGTWRRKADGEIDFSRFD